MFTRIKVKNVTPQKIGVKNTNPQVITVVDIDEHLSLESRNPVANKAIAEEINNIKTLIKEKTSSLGVENYQELVELLNNAEKTTYSIGQAFHIKAFNVPDMWIFGINDNKQSYAYTTDENIIEQTTEKTLQIGYYSISQMETNGAKPKEELNIINGDVEGSISTKTDDTTVENGLNVNKGAYSENFGRYLKNYGGYSIVNGYVNENYGRDNAVFGYGNIVGVAPDFTKLTNTGQQQYDKTGWISRMSMHGLNSDGLPGNEGNKDKAVFDPDIGSKSIVGGLHNRVKAKQSIVEGENNIIDNVNSSRNIIVGSDNIVVGGSNNVALGRGLSLNGFDGIQAAIGRYNKQIAKVLFMIGNGEAAQKDSAGNIIKAEFRSNAFEVYNDGHTQAGRSTTNEDNDLTLVTKDYISQILNNKLDKITGTTLYGQVYTKQADGNNVMVDMVSWVRPGSLIQRDADGYFTIKAPTEHNHPTPKSYIDTLMNKLNIVGCDLEGSIGSRTPDNVNTNQAAYSENFGRLLVNYGSYSMNAGYDNENYGRDNGIFGYGNTVGVAPDFTKLTEQGKQIYESTGWTVSMSMYGLNSDGIQGAEGNKDKAVFNTSIGTRNLVSGLSNTVLASNSLVSGTNNKLINTQGMGLVVGGSNNVIDSSVKNSLIVGDGLLVYNSTAIQNIIGRYNAKYAPGIFIVGNGASDKDRKNMFIVTKDGQVLGGRSTIDTDSGITLTTKDYVDCRGNNKLDKITYDQTSGQAGNDGKFFGRVYAVRYTGDQTSFPIANQHHNYSIPIRDHNNNFYVGDPKQDYHCVNKRTFDGKVGEIETALDTIIEIQNSLVLNNEIEQVADTIIQLQETLIGGNE